MTQTAYPKVGGSTTDVQFREMFSKILDTGAVLENDFAPSADSSGMNVKIAAGFAIVDGLVAKSTAQETLAIGTAPGSGLFRIDTVVECVDYTQNPIVYLKVLAGTPATSGNQAPPSLTPSGNEKFYWPICDVAIGPTTATITSGMVTDRRTFTGTNVGFWATSRRPSSPRLRQFGFNTTLSVWEFWDGDEWKSLEFSADQITSGTLNSARLPTVPISKGGTGATTKAAARLALGIRVDSTPMTAETADIGDLRFW